MRRTVLICLIMLYVIFLFPATIGFTYAEDGSYGVELTAEEKAYIKQHGTVKMCVDPDWYPYESINENGAYKGIAADLIALIAGRTGLDIELVPTKDWDESIQYSKEGKCDILSLLNETAERKNWLIFTIPYFVDPNVLITREEHSHISDIKALSDETAVLPEGTSIEERMRQDYPNVHIIIVSSEDEAVDYVSKRKADFTVRSQTMAAYTIREEGLFNLKIAGQIPEYANHLRIGVSKDEPVLCGILNKGIKSLSKEDFQNAMNRHISVEIQEGFDYKLFFFIVAVFAVIVASGLGWNRKLRALNKALEMQKQSLIEIGEQLAKSESLYRSILNASPDAIVIADMEGCLVMASPSAYKLLGYEEGEDNLVGRNVTEFISQKDHRKLFHNVKSLFGGKKIGTTEYEGIKKDGKNFIMEVNSEVIHNPGGTAYQMVSIVRDVSERRKTENRLKRREAYLSALTADLEEKNLALNEKVTIDKLTGLHNRYYLDQRIQEEVDLAERYGNALSILLFDLDKFKRVNDTYGHAVGDQVLIRIADNVKAMIRKTDVFARWGGEEFLILMTQTDLDATGAIAEKIRESIENILHPDVGTVTVSIGVAGYRKGESIDSWFNRADTELYRAKNEGRNRVCISRVEP